MKKGTYLKQVRDQYENYPYPKRTPEHEKGYLIAPRSSSLDCINFFCFEGARDFSKPFRVLIPGGGTGDCTIFLAEQLRDTAAEIVYLDMSGASMKLAQERAQIRQLKNITWIHDSILNLPNLDLGEFDFITCTGVLHHLADPVEGLKALKSVLHPDGSMYIMLYAKYGRTGIYQMQDLLRRIHANEPDMQKRVDKSRAILKNLPDGNWFQFNSRSFGFDLQSDIGLYDLLLHPQDRAYTVPELYNYIEGEGLTINKLYNPDHPLGDMLFKPETFIQDPAILTDIKSQSFKEQAAICELMFGQLMKQSCFISFKTKKQPELDDWSMIPSLAITETLQHKYEALKSAFCANGSEITLNPYVSFNRSPFAADLFLSIDGERSSKEVIDLVALKFSSFERSIIEGHYRSIVDILNKMSLLYVRHPRVPAYKSLQDIQQGMNLLYGEVECRKAQEAYMEELRQ